MTKRRVDFRFEIPKSVVECSRGDEPDLNRNRWRGDFSSKVLPETLAGLRTVTKTP